MAFKPNYNQQRAERDRLKNAKKEEKLKRKQEALNERRGADGELLPEPEGGEEAEPSV
jgi:hypothetical protein